MQNTPRMERIAAAFYLIWFFVHLVLFFYSEENPDNSLFWPFSAAGKSFIVTYDVSEFLVYIGTPLVLFIAYKIVFANEYDASSSGRKHSSASFFVAFLHEKIKAEELVQQLNELQGKPVNYDALTQLKADMEKASSQSVNNWLDRVEVRKKYKEFED